MWPFSYRLWATCIVRRAVKPSLRLASCCSVLVVNGGVRLRRVRLVFDRRDAELGRCAAARPSRWRPCSSSSSSSASLSLPVAGSKSLPAGILRPSTETSVGFELLAARLGKRGRAGPSTWPTRTPSAAARARRSAARRRSARGRPKASAAPCATTAARLRSRTAGRESAAFPGPAPGRRRSRADAPAPRGSPPS